MVYSSVVSWVSDSGHAIICPGHFPQSNPITVGHSCLLCMVLRGKDMGRYSTFRVVRTWRIPSQVVVGDFCSMPCIAYTAHVVTRLQVKRAYAIPVCVLFVPSTLGIIFRPSAGAVATADQRRTSTHI